jgi:hypothetical protein
MTQQGTILPNRTKQPNTMETQQLITAPESANGTTYETLGYAEAYDAPTNSDYAFVAYKETDSSGNWRVRISGKQTPGAVFEPEALRLKSRETAAQGKAFFTWGWEMEASASDQRCVQFRVYVENGRTSAIEMHLQMRNFDGSAAEPVQVRFAWPA